MREHILPAVLLASLLVVACRSSAPTNDAPARTSEPDAQQREPAEMKEYWFGLIRGGPGAGQHTEEELQELQRAHRANIGRLVEEGKMVLAGPFGGDGELRGIFVYDVATEAEARALVDSDPAVAAGRLEVELIPWWGPSRLVELVRE
jgi:uncharacterized protein YciI